MPKFLIHLPFILFILTALSGVWMRTYPFNLGLSFPYSNILHAHSHLAILGWAFLGVFIVFLRILWPRLTQKKHAILLTIIFFIVSTLMFVAFLYEGYATYSIILSTAHIFVEYWAAIFIYKQLKLQQQLPEVGKLFIKGSLIALILSSIGPFSLGFLAAKGLHDTHFFDMAIYFYLHFQYNGWLYLFLIGLFIFILHHKRIKLHSDLFKKGYWIYFISLFPGYFASVLWVDLGAYSRVLATIGSIGQWVGVLFVLIAIRKSWKPISAMMPKLTTVFFFITLLLLFFKSTMELGLIPPAMADMVYGTRSVIIGYLHFTLLGFISMFILTQFQMVNIIDTTKEKAPLGFLVFFGGFLLNELLLFITGLITWLNLPAIPFYNVGLLIASILLLIGIILLWSSVSNRKKRYQKI